MTSPAWLTGSACDNSRRHEHGRLATEPNVHVPAFDDNSLRDELSSLVRYSAVATAGSQTLQPPRTSSICSCT